MGRTLKNFDAYLQKLEGYAQAQEIAIERAAPKDADGVWMPNKRKIVIHESLADSTEIATLLHELGHTEDDALVEANTPEYRRIRRAYKVIYKDDAPDWAKAVTLERERFAWHLARGIAKRLRIPIGQWFEDEERDGLEFYKE